MLLYRYGRRFFALMLILVLLLSGCGIAETSCKHHAELLFCRKVFKFQLFHIYSLPLLIQLAPIIDFALLQLYNEFTELLKHYFVLSFHNIDIFRRGGRL